MLAGLARAADSDLSRPVEVVLSPADLGAVVTAWSVLRGLAAPTGEEEMFAAGESRLLWPWTPYRDQRVGHHLRARRVLEEILAAHRDGQHLLTDAQVSALAAVLAIRTAA